MWAVRYSNTLEALHQQALAGLGHFPSAAKPFNTIDWLEAALLHRLVTMPYRTAHGHQGWDLRTHTRLIHSRQARAPKNLLHIDAKNPRECEHLLIPCTLHTVTQQVSTHTMIDSGAAGSFCSLEFIKEYRVDGVASK